MNCVIERALQKAGLRSVLELPGLDWTTPDVIVVFPFSGDRSLVWHCTCGNTFAEVHLNRSVMEADTAANCTEERKRRKYAAPVEAHQFEPIAVGVFGVSTELILRAIGDKGAQLQGSPSEANLFRQKQAIDIP